MNKLSLYALILTIAFACAQSEKSKKAKDPKDEKTKTSTLIPQDWISTRVSDAKERLIKDEASRLLWQSIEAHGGLDKWYSNGILSFRFNYMPLDKGLQRDSYQSVDVWSSKSVHKLAADRKVKFGWDGSKAWKSPSDTDLKINSRFWSMTPYYFVGVPFVFADKGTKYELLDDEIIESAIHKRLKISYEDGVGDSPGDYYILYIDEETKKVDALIYIVSYPDFFPDGSHSEEKFMDYIGEQTVDGIVFAKEYKTYLRKRKKGFVKHVTDIELTNLKFSQKVPSDYFDMPSDAVVVK